MKYNLGCGNKKIDGYVNIDVCGMPDVKCDLSRFPWPIESDSADEVFSEHFLEHVQDYELTVLEMHRILKPNGILHFKVPYFKSMFYPWHLHKYAFSSVTCRLLCTAIDYQFEGRKLFEEVSLKFNFPYIHGKIRNKMFSFLANKFQAKWEYLGFPIEEIEFVARKSMVK